MIRVDKPSFPWVQLGDVVEIVHNISEIILVEIFKSLCHFLQKEKLNQTDICLHVVMA